MLAVAEAVAAEVRPVWEQAEQIASSDSARSVWVELNSGTQVAAAPGCVERSAGHLDEQYLALVAPEVQPVRLVEELVMLEPERFAGMAMTEAAKQ